MLAINLVFFVLLCFSLLASYQSPESSAFFAVFGLMYPLLLIINFLFVIAWALLRSKYFLFSLVPILIGFGHLKNNFQLRFTTDHTAEKNEIRVLTYNVQRFGMDADEETFNTNNQTVIDFLNDQNPDIVCLQEYHGKGKTLYEPLQNARTQLGAQSYYYESYFNPRYQQLTGLVIFSKYEAVNKGKLKFEGTRTFGIYTDVLMGADTVRIYNIHLASIQLKPSDIDFVVNPGQNQDEMGLHALQIYSKLADAFQLREKQMQHLLKELDHCPYPVILAGDFNDTPSSYIYKQITKLLEDTFVKKGNGFSITYGGRIPFLRIDYVMKSQHFDTRTYRRHLVDYSDHYPLSAGLQKDLF